MKARTCLKCFRRLEFIDALCYFFLSPNITEQHTLCVVIYKLTTGVSPLTQPNTHYSSVNQHHPFPDVAGGLVSEITDRDKEWGQAVGEWWETEAYLHL